MGIKWKTKVNKLPELTKNTETISGRNVKVGIFGDKDAWLAGIHEYGCNIRVTPKMRAYLHKAGLHLKDSTEVIKIPERSFLRTGHDKNADRVITQTERAVNLFIDGKKSLDDLLDVYGEQMATAIKEYMTELSKPANHPFTQEQKGDNNPLINTGGLKDSITWKKE